MAKKKKYNGPNFVPNAQPKMSCAEKDNLFVHLIRLKGFFEEGLARLPLGILGHEDDRYKIILNACHKIAKNGQAKPGEKKFRGVLKNEIYQLTKELDLNEMEIEAAEDIISKGGFLDEAYEAAKADLSDHLGRTLLQRYLYELELISPLSKLLNECSSDKGVPKDIVGVLETLLERARKLESVEAKATKTFGEEWDEHLARLDYYRGKTMIGLKTGLPELDKRTLGLRGLFVFGAKPGAGKTTYACVQVALGVCRHFADNECVVIVVCLDMDRFELYRRMHCNLGDIEWVPLMFGSPEGTREKGSMFSKPHNACLKRAKEKFAAEQIDQRLTVPDRTVLGDDVTVQRLTSIIREHKVKAGAKRALLLIDYLQLIPVPEEVAGGGDLAADKYRIRLVQQVIERSRTTDDPLGDTALVISEARKPATSKDKDHWGDSMSELMGSARLGYAADAVLLYREMSVKEIEDSYGITGKEAAGKKRDALLSQGIAPVTLILEKGRDGMMRGKWGAEFFYRKSAFRELPAKGHLLPSAPPASDTPASDEVTGKGGGSAAGGPMPLPTPGPGFHAKPKKKAKGKDAAHGTKSTGTGKKSGGAGKGSK